MQDCKSFDLHKHTQSKGLLRKYFFFTLANSLCVKYISSYIRLAEGGWKIVLLWVKHFEANVN